MVPSGDVLLAKINEPFPYLKEVEKTSTFVEKKIHHIEQQAQDVLLHTIQEYNEQHIIFFEHAITLMLMPIFGFITKKRYWREP